jgi:hypothetical protein
MTTLISKLYAGDASSHTVCPLPFKDTAGKVIGRVVATWYDDVSGYTYGKVELDDVVPTAHGISNIGPVDQWGVSVVYGPPEKWMGKPVVPVVSDKTTGVPTFGTMGQIPAVLSWTCEACGLIGAKEYVYVHTTNGGLSLCPQCLAEINRKNPELKLLREKLSRLVVRFESGPIPHWQAAEELAAIIS